MVDYPSQCTARRMYARKREKEREREGEEEERVGTTDKGDTERERK